MLLNQFKDFYSLDEKYNNISKFKKKMYECILLKIYEFSSLSNL